ncbi:hypothetical protein BC835DRAFT_929780 [Cytidiella melzeri]|nr:hypothetical protein BC835DRAFT_929780 [Cytidiella melzeri]
MIWAFDTLFELAESSPNSICRPNIHSSRLYQYEFSLLKPLRKPGNFRITPSPSPLRSLTITAPMVSFRKNDFKEKYAAVKKEVEAGWVSGVRQLTVTGDRMKTTWINGATKVLVEDSVPSSQSRTRKMSMTMRHSVTAARQAQTRARLFSPRPRRRNDV